MAQTQPQNAKAVNTATDVLTQIAQLATIRLDDAKLAKIVDKPTSNGLYPVHIQSSEDPTATVWVTNATPYIPAVNDECYVYCVDNDLSPVTAFIIQIKGKDGNYLQKLFTAQINAALANWTAPSSNASSETGSSIINTWRPILVNNTPWKSTYTNSGALNLIAGTNISLVPSDNTLTINATGGWPVYTATLPLEINNDVISLNIGAGLQTSNGNLTINNGYFGVVGQSTTTAPTFFAPTAAGAAGQILKSKGSTTVGGTTTYYGSEWVDIESLIGDPGAQEGGKYLKWVWEQDSGGFVWDTPADVNTWRPILVNGTSWKTSAPDSAVNFIAGTNVTLVAGSTQGHENELTISANNTWRDIVVAGDAFKGNGTDTGTLKFSEDFWLTGGDPEVSPPVPDTISINPDFLGALQDVRYPQADNKIIASYSYTPPGSAQSVRGLHWVDLPVVNDASLLIQKNGTTVATFTANASSNVTANIVVPTKTSDLINDGSDNTSTYLEADETAYETASIPFGRCNPASTSTAFIATVPGITELRDGVCMLLKNGVITSAANFTININNLGPKPVYNNMAAATRDSTIFNVNYTMLFIYDATRVEGGCWICYRGYNSDTNTIAYQVRTNSTVLPTSDTCRYYKIFFTSADGTQWVPAAADIVNDAATLKTVNQRPINPFGDIVYTSASTRYTAGSSVAATTLWRQYNLTLGYSFNRTGEALALNQAPVYIKCAPQADGSAIIDSTTPYVQALPSTDDGKIYIFLGIATSGTQVEMTMHHPVYYYKDGALREWTNCYVPTEIGDLNHPSAQGDEGKVPMLISTPGGIDVAWQKVSYNDLTDTPTITLNGTQTTSPNFYAPISVGSAGQILKTIGSGAPQWADIESLLGAPGAQQEGKYLKWTWSQGSGGFEWDDPADSDTWRPIWVDNTLWKSTTTDSAVNFIGGTNVTLTTGNTQGHYNDLTIDADDTWRDIYVNGTSWKGNGTDTGYIDFVYNEGLTITRGGAGHTNELKFALNVATSSAIGGVGIGFTSSGRNYGVEIDESHDAFVYVPWTDTTYTAGNGLNLNGTTFSVKTTQGSGINVDANGISVENPVPEHLPGDGKYLIWNGSSIAWGGIDVATSSAIGGIKIGYSEPSNEKKYAVQLDNSNKAFVEVPWTDTTYTFSTGLTTSGTTISVTNPLPAIPTAQGDVDKVLIVSDSGGANHAVWSKLGSLAYLNSVPLATDGTRGGIQIGYSQTGQKYPVELASEKAYVEVPWTDTTYTFALPLSKDANNQVSLGYGVGLTTDGGNLVIDDTHFGSNAFTSTTIPTVYIKNASTSGNTLTLTKQDNTTVTFSDTNTTYTLAAGTGEDDDKLILTPSSGNPNKVTVPYAVTADSATTATTANTANSVLWANVSGHDAGVDADLGIDTTSGSTTQFLTKKGTWATPAGTYTLPLAADGTRGGIQIGYTQNGKNYPVLLDNEKAYVNVPWTGTVTSVTLTSGTGITVSDSGTAITTSGTRTISLNVSGAQTALGLKQLAYIEADNASDDGKYLKAVADGDAFTYEWATPTNTNTWRPIKYSSTTLNDTSTTLEFIAGTNIGLAFSSGQLTITNNYSLPLAASGTRGGIQIGYSQTGKKYPVELASEKAYVEVPWTDTTYTFSTGLTTSNTTISVTNPLPYPIVTDQQYDGYVLQFNYNNGTNPGFEWVSPSSWDTNTTYALSGALSNHKFTSTLTATNPSGTSTSAIEFVAGSNVTLTDDTTNKKITIAATDTTYSGSGEIILNGTTFSHATHLTGASSTAALYKIGLNDYGHVVDFVAVQKSDITALGIPGQDTNTTYSLAVNGTGANANKLGLTAGGSGSGTSWVTIPYATTASSATTATSAVKATYLYDPDNDDPIDLGSSTQAVYFADGLPALCTYSLNKTVPADAVFTDTTYTFTTGLTTNNTTISVTNPLPSIPTMQGDVDKVLIISDTGGANHAGWSKLGSLAYLNVSSLYWADQNLATASSTETSPTMSAPKFSSVNLRNGTGASNTTTKATMVYNTTLDVIEFTFA